MLTDGPWKAVPDMRPVERRYWMDAFDGGEEYLAGWDIVADNDCVVGCEGIIDGPNAEGDARLMAASPELLEALVSLLKRDEQNTCQHAETHRGGLIWEICDLCGAKWADDEGGKPEWKDPPEWEAARKAISKALTGE